MNYKIKMTDSGVGVIETATEQMIKKFETVESAKKFMRYLNLGGGFDGWSPTFILKSMEPHLKDKK